MAKSKSGGTRSYIRGRVGADVYSIGKDSKGKKQQVVRSLAESVANPQTESQMRGRMIMSTVMQAESALAQIIDHSFDNVPNGQPSLSEFIRRNYALVKADVAAHPASGNSFGLNKYQEKGAKAGAWVIAAGSAVPANVINAPTTFVGVVISLPTGTEASALSVKSIREAIGLSEGDYFTSVNILSDGTFAAARFFIPQADKDETIVTADNFKSLFQIEEINMSLSLDTSTLADNGQVAMLASGIEAASHGVITSRKTASGWIHNDAVLVNTGTNIQFTADVALPTYPVGTARFLNGGDL